VNVIRPDRGPVPRRIGVVVSTFNAAITGPMAEAAVKQLERAGVHEVVLIEVAGALELPVTVLRVIEAGCEGVVAVGAVIKGETDHYEHVAAETVRGLGEVALRTGRPVGNAVLTVRDYDHAVDRSLPGPGNKGAEAASAVVEACQTLAGLD